jgi:hypothetical protein
MRDVVGTGAGAKTVAPAAGEAQDRFRFTPSLVVRETHASLAPGLAGHVAGSSRLEDAERILQHGLLRPKIKEDQ